LPSLFSVVFVDAGAKKRLGYFYSRRAAVAAATRLARQLRVTVRGRWSSFYQRVKCAEYHARQQRVAARAANRGARS